jgi:hypothetical protein
MTSPIIGKKVRSNKTRKAIRPQDVEDLKVILKFTSLYNTIFHKDDLAQAMRKTTAWLDRNLDDATIAQACLEVFKDAPVNVRKHWHMELKKALAVLDSNVTVKVGSKDGKTEKFTVKKEQTKKTTKNIGSLVAPTKVSSEKKVFVDAKADEVEVILDKVRDAYVLAPVGDLPNIRSILVEYGVIDNKTGNSLLHGINEKMVRIRASQEDWRGSRMAHLYTTFDVIPDEMRLAAAVRNFELHKMMYQRMKSANILLAQYERSGVVKSLDGTTTLDRIPTLSDMAATAEVMRRMVDGSGNIQILIQQIAGQQQKATGEADAINTEVRKHMSRLANMNAAQLELEVEKMERLRSLIHSDQILEAEVIDQNDVID